MELDLHVHSMYSFDSFLKPEKIIKTAKKRGLNGVAITDHSTIQGGLSARKYKEDDFTIIIGAEIKTEVGDIIGLFLNEEIESNEIGSVIDEIRCQDGIIILPHPFRANQKKYDEELFNKIDAIEAYNARTEEKKNIQAQEFAREHKLPITAGSDAHFAGEIGLARVVMDNIASEEDIRKAILCNDIEIKGIQAPLYFRGASRIVANIKAEKWCKLPETLLKISIKGGKTYLNKRNV